MGQLLGVERYVQKKDPSRDKIKSMAKLCTIDNCRWSPGIGT